MLACLLDIRNLFDIYRKSKNLKLYLIVIDKKYIALKQCVLLAKPQNLNIYHISLPILPQINVCVTEVKLNCTLYNICLGGCTDMRTFGVNKEGDGVLELCNVISCILREPIERFHLTSRPPCWCGRTKEFKIFSFGITAKFFIVFKPQK